MNNHSDRVGLTYAVRMRLKSLQRDGECDIVYLR